MGFSSLTVTLTLGTIPFAFWIALDRIDDFAVTYNAFGGLAAFALVVFPGDLIFFFVVAIAQLRLQREGEHAVVEIDGEHGVAPSFMDHRRALKPVVLSWVLKMEALTNGERFIEFLFFDEADDAV